MIKIKEYLSKENMAMAILFLILLLPFFKTNLQLYPYIAPKVFGFRILMNFALIMLLIKYAGKLKKRYGI